jgi:hypothetical protein
VEQRRENTCLGSLQFEDPKSLYFWWGFWRKYLGRCNARKEYGWE